MCIDPKELARLLEDVKQPDDSRNVKEYTDKNRRATDRLLKLGLDRETVGQLSLLPEKR